MSIRLIMLIVFNALLRLIMLIVFNALFRTNHIVETGGHPKWEALKQGHLTFLKNYEITGKPLCVQSK